jgi:hypothetical protein
LQVKAHNDNPNASSKPGNYFLSGTLVGERAASSYTLFDNFRFFYRTVYSWFLPSSSIGIYLISIFLVAATWILFRLDRDKSLNRETIKPIGPCLLFILFYTGIIVISSTTTAYDQISDRLLSPIFVPVVFILFFIYDKILSWITKYFNSQLITPLFMLVIILLISSPANGTIRIIKNYIQQSGWGYSSDSWRKSETIEYLNQHKLPENNYTFYSNEPEAVYILTNLVTRCSPAKTFYNSVQLYNTNLNQKDIWLNADNVCLIWFYKTNRSYLFTIDELQKSIKMTEVAHLKDGGIYTFSGK